CWCPVGKGAPTAPPASIPSAPPRPTSLRRSRHRIRSRPTAKGAQKGRLTSSRLNGRSSAGPSAGGLDAPHPAVGVGRATVLQIEQPPPEQLGDGSGASVADREGAAPRLHGANRRDHGRRATSKDL